jgi:hypothetical protein
MGLDMYLFRKSYVKNWDFMKDEDKHTVSVKKNGMDRTDIDPNRISYITEHVASWRKFNALHGYIVENHANGRDECQQIALYVDDLNEILNTLVEIREELNSCEVVDVEVECGVDRGKPIMRTIQVFKSKKANELLPTRSGFFFGSEHIDEYYKALVEQTIDIFQNLVDADAKAQEEGNDYEYYYQASW